jgi:hypothetical protein
VIGETEALLGKAIDVGSLELFLPVTSEITNAEIVGENVDDVWLESFGHEKTGESEGQEENFFHEALGKYCVG